MVLAVRLLILMPLGRVSVPGLGRLNITVFNVVQPRGGRFDRMLALPPPRKQCDRRGHKQPQQHQQMGIPELTDHARPHRVPGQHETRNNRTGGNGDHRHAPSGTCTTTHSIFPA